MGKTQIAIRYITPYATDKNIGKEYNRVISELPDDCYVVLRDVDTMFLSPDCGRHIEAIIRANPEYSVITCMTNRLGLPECLVEGEMNDLSMITQIEMARVLWNDYGATVKPTSVAPGMLMIFHKSVWERNPFMERTMLFDRLFSEVVLREGGKIGIAQGLYIFHLYRYGKPNPQNYTRHLV